jgi:hypothetical protein
MMPEKLSARITQIAIDSNVPECWPCTLVRISLRLRPLVFVLGAGCGFVLGALLCAWVLA